MSPDILPGLGAGASAPPVRTGPAATGPPGDAGLSALFASLLAQSGGPQPKGGAILALSSKQTAPGSLSTFTLPIKAAPTKTAKPDPMKPLPPPTAGAAAETQNAMDTIPVSGPRKAKASETKPGGELPLLEARTIPSVAYPAPPLLFIAIAPIRAAALTRVVEQSGPIAVPQGVALQTVSGAAPSVAPTPPVQTLSAQALPAPVVLRSDLPAAIPPTGAAVNGEEPAAVGTAQVAVPPGLALPVTAVPTAPPALPKTWTLPATPMPERPLPTGAPQSAAIASATPEETATGQLKPAAETPYVVAGQTLTVPAHAVTVADGGPAPTVKTENAPAPSPGPSSRPQKATTAFLPIPKSADVSATAPPSLAVPRPTLSVPDPAQVDSVAAASQTVLAAVPIQQKPPLAINVPLSDEGKEEIGPSVTAGSQIPAAKISLKSLGVSADNNTGTQMPPTNRPGSLPVKPANFGEPFGRPVTKVGDGNQGSQEGAAPVPNQAPTVSTQTLAAAPAPLTRTDRAEVVRQVADAVGTMPTPARPGAASQMTLQLHPKDWGQLQITVRTTPAVQGNVTQKQTVTAHVVAASPQIKAVLDSGSGDLRHALRQAGLHLDKLTVTVQAPESGTKSGMTAGGGHQLSGGNGGQSPPDGRPSGNGQQGGSASFASFTGSPQGGRPDGQSAPPQASAYETGEQMEEPAADRGMPQRAVPGQVDMRA